MSAVRENPAVSGNVVADLNYIVAPNADPRVVYADGKPPRFEGGYGFRPTEIRDARGLDRNPALDREGFELRRAPTDFRAFDDGDAVRDFYYAEAVGIVKKATGADQVVVFDHTVRKTRSDLGRFPAQHVHVDFTDISAPRRIAGFLGEGRAERLLAGRHLQVNVWRAFSGPVLRSPLAFADAGSVLPDDLVRAGIEYRDKGRGGEIFGLRYDPAQRWYYFSDMDPDEVALIKGYDSDGGRARFTPHSAFEHPATPVDAPARASIEVRTFAFFDPV